MTFQDEEGLKTKIREFLPDKQRREKIAENGRIEVLKRHTYDNRIAEILDIIAKGD
jgi:spore maturation protein CgeB